MTILTPKKKSWMSKSMNAEQEHDDYKSKSQVKREMQEIKKIGEKLVNLGTGLKQVPIDDELAAAIELARKINKKKDGYRRQLLFIGKLLRARDIDPIEEALKQLEMHHQQNTAKFHQLEVLRDKLLGGGDTEIQETLEAYPFLERQKLRQLLRTAQKQQSQNKPPSAARELFQYLKAEIGKE